MSVPRSRRRGARTAARIAAAVAVALALAATLLLTAGGSIAAGSRQAAAAAADAAGAATSATSAPAPSGDSSETTAPPAPSRDSSETTTLPAQMRDVGDARQLIVVTGDRLGSKVGTFTVFELRDGSWVTLMQTKAWLGMNGLKDGTKRREGDHTTPTGIWRIPGFAFGMHAKPPSGTKLAYQRITNRSYWSGVHDKTYNRWAMRSHKIRGEHLIDSRRHYEFALSTGYNATPNPRVMTRGFAIFLHVHATPGYTHGCVALSRTDMIRVLRLIDPAKRPRFAIGTTRVGDATSIWAY